MGLLYIDAEGNYTDPASSGLKYMRADGQWANPDAAYKFLDATGSWSVPELGPLPESIADASWADIERISKAAAKAGGVGFEGYLGQTKTIDLSALGNGCASVTLMVIGICHDVSPDCDTLGLTFQARNGLPYQGFSYDDGKNTGWHGSTMRNTHMSRILAAMPADLRAVIKGMVKKNSSLSANNTSDRLALLSITELTGTGDEGTQYEWYQSHGTNSDRIIRRSDGNAGSYWLRNDGYYVLPTGATSNSGTTDAARMPVFHFCV